MGVTVIFTQKEGSVLPEYKSAEAAGADLFAFIPSQLILQPLERKLIPTGISIEIPQGYEAQVRPRSGLALKFGITVLNSPGTIDSDYRGEIGVVLVNLGNSPFIVDNGDRIAQLVFASVERCSFRSVEKLNNTERGTGGYGSTDKK